MTISEIVPSDVIIDLDDPPTGHRLTELLQALTGCSVESAELAISDPTPAGPASPDDAPCVGDGRHGGPWLAAGSTGLGPLADVGTGCSSAAAVAAPSSSPAPGAWPTPRHRSSRSRRPSGTSSASQRASISSSGSPST